jgi:hypothetical protein
MVGAVWKTWPSMSLPGSVVNTSLKLPTQATAAPEVLVQPVPLVAEIVKAALVPEVVAAVLVPALVTLNV